MASALSDQSICPDLLASIDNFDVALLDAYSRFRQPAPQPSLPSGLPAMKLSFLSHFTATSGFASSFDCGNSLQRAQIMKKLTPRPIQLPPSPTKSPEMTGCHIEDGRYEATATCIDKHNTSRPGVTSCCWSCHPLYLKSEEIVQGIRKTVEATNMESWTPTMEQECRQFFSPPQIERLVVAFFALWYPNVPIFHRPSFITAHKPAPVVAALALVGATLTSNESEYLGAKRWIDIVEEYVFSDPCLCTDPLPSCTKPTFELMLTLSPRLDAIRAAYCVVLFMQWEGDGVQSSRARSMRYPKVIASTRSILAVDTIQHDPLPTYLEEGQPFMNWKRFTLTEEYIRALLYVFLLDCAFKMFNNCSPRMLSSELNIGLTCPEICFQVANVEEWRRHMRVWAASETGRAQPLVRDVLHFVVKPDLSLSEWTVLCEMGPLNFFALANGKYATLYPRGRDRGLICVLAFQNMIFHCHDPQAARKKAQIYPALAKMEITDKVAVLQGLRNWKRAWMCRRTVLGDYDIYQVGAGNSWQRVGFFRHGFEFWRLALIVYRNLEATGWLKWDTSFVDKSDMKDVHELITKFQNVNIGEYEL